MPVAATLELIRPFAVLAAVAFIIGFVGSLAFIGPTASAQAYTKAQPAVMSGPSSEDWNLPKRI